MQTVSNSCLFVMQTDFDNDSIYIDPAIRQSVGFIAVEWTLSLLNFLNYIGFLKLFFYIFHKITHSGILAI